MTSIKKNKKGRKKAKTPVSGEKRKPGKKEMKKMMDEMFKHWKNSN